VVVLGAGGVGKSALTIRFIRDVFVENYDPTIEEQYRRTITVDGQLDMLEVLDTAGAEQFTSLNEVYIKVATSFNTIRRSSDNSISPVGDSYLCSA